MFGKKKEVYTMPPEKSARGKAKVPPQSIPEETADDMPSEPVQLYNEEVRTNDGADFLHDEPYDASISGKRKKAKPPKKEKVVKAAKPAKAEKVPFFRDKRKVGILLVSVSTLVLLVVSPLLNYFTTTKVSTAVVAKEDIRQGTQITEELIATVDVPEASLLSIHLRDGNMAAGQYAKTDIAKDELITTPKLSATLPYANDYLYVLPTGKKAISITVPSLASGLSGKLQQGDVISIYVLLEKEDKTKDFAAILPPELTYVQVLSATNADGYDVSGAVQESDLESALPSTVTLVVNDIQAGLLAGLETQGKLHAALVTRGEKTTAENCMAIQEDYFNQLEEKKKVEAEEEEAASSSEADDAQPEAPVEPAPAPLPAPKPVSPPVIPAPSPATSQPQSQSIPEASQEMQEESTSGGDEE